MSSKIELHDVADDSPIAVGLSDVRAIHERDGTSSVVLMDGNSVCVKEDYDRVCGLIDSTLR